MTGGKVDRNQHDKVVRKCGVQRVGHRTIAFDIFRHKPGWGQGNWNGVLHPPGRGFPVWIDHRGSV